MNQKIHPYPSKSPWNTRVYCHCWGYKFSHLIASQIRILAFLLGDLHREASRRNIVVRWDNSYEEIKIHPQKAMPAGGENTNQTKDEDEKMNTADVIMTEDETFVY